MSSGVSDQMKIPGNSAKHVEDRNIPWSQQVEEAAYENLASPTTDDSSATTQNSMQFQYPPFNAKENQNSSWNTNRPRKPSNNYDINKKYGKPAYYNSKREECPPNAWVSQNSKKIIGDNPSHFHMVNKSHDMHGHEKLDNRFMTHGMSDERKVTVQPPVSVPKKTTWASIASQPAKLTSRTTSSSSHKKKGPGMPPPPMVPGKNDLDVNAWDLPNNNPPPVPSPPPPIDLGSADMNTDFSASVDSDYEYGRRSERGGQKPIDILRDDNKSSSNNSNYGRMRNSPNGHARKNWITQPHPLQQNRPPAPHINAGPMRRGDTNSSNRYVERRGGQYPASRNEQDNMYNYRDENSARDCERPASVEELPTESPQAILDELRVKNNYNPDIIDLDMAALARFFVIKSYAEDDIHRSIKYEIWCSTERGNKRLDDAFKERQKKGGNILLFFSVNKSMHFCGMAQMMTAVDYNSKSTVWSQDKWKGTFGVKWIYVKDVPHISLRHIRLENNENKSVTHSRDTQEVPSAKGIDVLKILHSYKHTTSIFDDFLHYEIRQEEEVSSKKPLAHDSHHYAQAQSPVNQSRHYGRVSEDRDRDRDGRMGGAPKFAAPSSGGGGGGGTNAFRDRNNTSRSGYYSHNNYNDHRRFESHRTGGNSDYQPKEREPESDKDSGEYGSRHAQKFDHYRRDARTQIKHSKERDFSEDQKVDGRFRSGPRDLQKDNEYSNSDRNKSHDY